MRLSWTDVNDSRRYDDFEIQVIRNETKAWFPESDSAPTTVMNVHYRLVRCIKKRDSVTRARFERDEYRLEEINDDERDLWNSWYGQEFGEE